MGAVKMWLMEMQEHAWYVLEQDISVDEARKQFLSEYPNNVEVFENVRKMLTEDHGGF